LTAEIVPPEVRCMSFWLPNLPLTQATVPSSAVICWAAGSGTTSASAAEAVAGTASSVAAMRDVRRERGMTPSSANGRGRASHLGLGCSHLRE